MAKKKSSNYFEKWLLVVAEKLRAGGLTVHLAYGDRFMGSRLILSMSAAAGLATLFLHRSAERKASLVLVVESKEVLDLLVTQLTGIHKSVSRFENAKRKFIHRIERMLELLQESYAIRAAEYPTAPFGKLFKIFPDAKTMVGLETRFRQKEHEEGATTLESDDIDEKEEKRFPTRYGAKIPHEEKAEVVLYNDAKKLFECSGKTAQKGQKLVSEQGGAPADFGLFFFDLPPVEMPPDDSWWSRGSNGDPNNTSNSSSSSWCDVPDCGNIGGCDIPDCDLPDCSLPDIDCGGLDCGGLDCGGFDCSF